MFYALSNVDMNIRKVIYVFGNNFTSGAILIKTQEKVMHFYSCIIARLTFCIMLWFISVHLAWGIRSVWPSSSHRPYDWQLLNQEVETMGSRSIFGSHQRTIARKKLFVFVLVEITHACMNTFEKIIETLNESMLCDDKISLKHPCTFSLLFLPNHAHMQAIVFRLKRAKQYYFIRLFLHLTNVLHSDYNAGTVYSAWNMQILTKWNIALCTEIWSAQLQWSRIHVYDAVTKIHKIVKLESHKKNN